jgi:choline dehydrogenase-like flavoprotein
MTRRWDLAVIGAGFAGLAAAHAAAARGLRVVVMDRKSEAGERPHTTGLLVKEVADEWDVPGNLDSRLSPGYVGWVVPGLGRTQVGLAVNAGRRADVDAVDLLPQPRAPELAGLVRRAAAVQGGPAVRSSRGSLTITSDAAAQGSSRSKWMRCAGK